MRGGRRVEREGRARGVSAAVMAAGLAALAAGGASCSASTAGGTGPKSEASATVARVDARAATAALVAAEGEAIDWLAAADPRLAQRLAASASDAVLKRVGMEAVMAEDATAQIRGRSLDLFAFRARAKAIDEAAKVVAASGAIDALPDQGLPGTGVARPRLERELLSRLIDEERARVTDEAALGEGSGDIVRAILAEWTPPASPQEVPERDVWISRRLLQIRDSLRRGGPRTGPGDLDLPLYPLERLLAPLVFPHGAAALAELRVAMDDDPRPSPPLVSPDRVAASVRAHLGVDVGPDEGAVASRFARLEEVLRDRVLSLRAEGPDDGGAALDARRLRALLFVEAPCAPVAESRVRSAAPPPERAAICGLLSALPDLPLPAALALLHDDLALAMAAVTRSPPPRTRLLTSPDGEVVDALERAARERPAVAVGLALAVEILVAGGESDIARRLAAWRALGDAPLDVVARNVAPTR